MAEQAKEIAGFELISKLGQGAMGAVFKARQKSLDRIVALKLLPPSIAKDTKFIERFQREARACAKLNHPNIVQGVDVGQDPATGVWYFAMEYIDGPSALKLLKTEGVVSERRALEIVRAIASALECATAHGIVHRDIKPDNILLTSSGEPKMADLGLARQVNDDASLTQAGHAIGTPHYMAPEQVRGRTDQYDARTDIYALGGTLFHLVTGKPPFAGETSAVIMSKHLTDPAPKAHKVNPAVTEDCSRLIERMMQKERNQRLQSPTEVVAQVDRLLRGEVTAARRPVQRNVTARQKGESARAPGSKLPLIIGGAAALLILAIVALRGPSAPATPKPPPDNRTAAAPTPVQPAPQPVIPPKELQPTPPPKPEPAPPADTPPPPKPEPTPPVTPATPPTPEPEKTPVPPLTPAPKPAPQTPAVELPLDAILAALREHAPKKAADSLQEGNYVSKAAMLEALNVLVALQERRLKAFQDQVGKNLRLETAKGPQNGQLTSFKGDKLQLERPIMINGQAQGSTQVTVDFDDLLPACLERIAPTPAPATAADWIASALAAMAAGQLDAADAALGHAAGHELCERLATELKRIRVQEREAQARAAWAAIEARAAEPPTQTRAKQILEELAAFVRKFADSDFAATPEIVAKIAELKEKFERLSLGLDPRVLKLFKGRILNYDARTQVITLGYDFSTKEQTEDFIDSIWAPPGDHTGLTWKKGQLRTFCKSVADRLLKMPQFLSGTLAIQLDYKKLEGARTRFEVEVSLFGVDSPGKTPKVSFRASDKGCVLLSNNAEVKSNPDEILLKHDGVLKLSCQNQLVSVKVNDQPIIEHALAKPNDHSGFWIGGGWDSGITFTKMQVSGRLDPVWLAKALEPPVKSK